MNAISRMALALTVGAALVTVGCTKESPPGGPGAVSGTQQHEPGSQGAEGQAVNKEDTFTLEVPAGNINLEQGATKETSIDIDRGDKFNQSVTVTFKPPAGITVEPTTVMIMPDQEKAQVKITADATAPMGKASIEVDATPESGKAVAQTVNVEVHQAKNSGDQKQEGQQGTPRQASEGNTSSSTK